MKSYRQTMVLCTALNFVTTIRIRSWQWEGVRLSSSACKIITWYSRWKSTLTTYCTLVILVIREHGFYLEVRTDVFFTTATIRPFNDVLFFIIGSCISWFSFYDYNGKSVDSCLLNLKKSSRNSPLWRQCHLKWTHWHCLPNLSGGRCQSKQVYRHRLEQKKAGPSSFPNGSKLVREVG